MTCIISQRVEMVFIMIRQRNDNGLYDLTKRQKAQISGTFQRNLLNRDLFVDADRRNVRIRESKQTLAYVY